MESSLKPPAIKAPDQMPINKETMTSLSISARIMAISGGIMLIQRGICFTLNPPVFTFAR